MANYIAKPSKAAIAASNRTVNEAVTAEFDGLNPEESYRYSVAFDILSPNVLTEDVFTQIITPMLADQGIEVDSWMEFHAQDEF